MFNNEENMMFLLDLYYDIKSVDVAKEELEDCLKRAEHLKEILDNGEKED